MPTCNVCGYAVEYLRACYSARWRLFRDRPDVTVKGMYVFAPAGTPHYPGFHNFVSRIWTAGDDQTQTALGEVLGSDHPFTPGTLDVAPPPPALLLGSADCVRLGERYPLPVIARTFFQGFDSRCWGNAPPILPDVTSRDVLTNYALVSDLLYTNPTAAATLLEGLLGPGAVVTTYPNDATLFPGCLIGDNGKYAVVVISGTSNFQQLAMQILYAGGGPVDYGIYGTNPIWEAAWLVIHTRIVDAGIPADRPILIVGHSYGGAVATLLAVRYNQGNPDRGMALITYGAPRPGDQRVSDLVTPVRQTRLENVGDYAASVPPSAPYLIPFLGILGLEEYGRWLRWQPGPGRVQLAEDGSLTPGPASETPYSQLLGIVQAAMAANPFDPIGPHAVKAYFLRLLQ